MEKEEINILAQLLTSMKDAARKLEEAYRKKDAENRASVKNEILYFQEEIKKRI